MTLGTGGPQLSLSSAAPLASGAHETTPHATIILHRAESSGLTSDRGPLVAN